MIECPKCGDTLVNSAVCCTRCGWARAGAGGGEQDWRCAHVDRGQRCANAGGISLGVRGGGPWYCRDHFMGGVVSTETKRSAPSFAAIRKLVSRVVRRPDKMEELERAALRQEHGKQ